MEPNPDSALLHADQHAAIVTSAHSRDWILIVDELLEGFAWVDRRASGNTGGGG